MNVKVLNYANVLFLFFENRKNNVLKKINFSFNPFNSFDRIYCQLKFSGFVQLFSESNICLML